MKLYFTTSPSCYQVTPEVPERIFEVARHLRNTIDSLPLNAPEKMKELQKDPEKLYKTTLSKIRASDSVVAEISDNSAALGFELALALEEKKPVLVLYQESRLSELPPHLAGNNSKYLKIRKYRAVKDLETAIKYFLEDVRDIIDTKFILIIPPEIDRYLEWNVREKGVSKAEVTREAIEKIMKTDSHYQEHLDTLTQEE